MSNKSQNKAHCILKLSGFTLKKPYVIKRKEGGILYIFDDDLVFRKVSKKYFRFS